jgi:hypothetical protein
LSSSNFLDIRIWTFRFRKLNVHFCRKNELQFFLLTTELTPNQSAGDPFDMELLPQYVS